MASKAENVTQLPGTVPETLAGAMARAFAAIEGATKDSVNPAFKAGGKVSKYADLTSVIEAIKPALIANGLFFTQRPQPHDHGVCIETVVGHVNGGEISLGTLYVPANKQDAQGFGSALTYARRYALLTAFGVPVEDDDGNAASRIVAGGQSDSARSAPGGNTDSSAQGGMPDAEFAKIGGLIKATGTNIGEFVKYFGIPNIGEMTRAQYAEGVEMLEKKLAKAATEQTNQVADKWGSK